MFLYTDQDIATPETSCSSTVQKARANLDLLAEACNASLKKTEGVNFYNSLNIHYIKPPSVTSLTIQSMTYNIVSCHGDISPLHLWLTVCDIPTELFATTNT